jgi:hypothetical protein
MSSSYRTHTSSTTPRLSAAHRRMLYDESAIDPEVVAERGVRTVRSGRELPKQFSWRQKRRAPGILFTAHRPNGKTSYIFRPDTPDPESPGHKYEQPPKCYGGAGNVLDVHPSHHHRIGDVSVPVMFCEGTKKADSMTSAARDAGLDIVVVSIPGVWNFLSDGKPIADMFDIPVEGRKVSICFDSDHLHNSNVQDAERRLAEHLITRGAKVWNTFLHDKPDGSKMGLDDFFAGGGTIAELRLLMRWHDPRDFVKVRLSRDERLRLALEDLERMFWHFEWKGMGGHSARDVYLKLIEGARRHGKVVDDGVRVKKAWGPLELEAKVSRRTLSKAIARLEEWGFLYRDNEGREVDKTGAFVLRATVNQYGEGRGQQEKATQVLQGSHHGGLHPRAARLRWSSPGSRPRRGTVEGTRMVRKGTRRPPRDPIKRLGKIRGHIIDALENAGGELEVRELAATLHKPRARDLVRAKSRGSTSGRNGPVIMLLQAGIVEWACEVGTRREVLRLTPNWLGALENARRLGKEVEADELAAKRHRLKSRAFHSRHRTAKTDRAPTEEELAVSRPKRLKRRRVDKLVAQGMARHFAEAAVWGTPGERPDPLGDVQPLGEPPRQRAGPRLVDGIYVHDGGCACEWCFDGLEVMSYATPGRAS